MALDGYKELEFNAGDCVDSDDVIDILQNTLVIEKSLQQNGSNIFCQEIECEAVSPSEGEIGCCEVEPLDVDTTPLSNDSLSTDKRIFMLQMSAVGSARFSGSDEFDNPDFSFRYEVYCEYNGTETNIYTSPATQGEPRVVYFEADCPRTATLRFCIVHDVIFPSGFNLQNSSGTARFCGAVLSVRDGTTSSLASSGFYCPGEMDPDCCQDKTALYLASQNANALCRSFAENCDQSLKIVRTNSTGIGSSLIQQGLTGKTTWVTSGSVKVCYRSRSYETDSYINVTPTITCGATSKSCGTRRIDVPRNNQGDSFGTIKCVFVPVILCGTCKEGDDLNATLVSAVQCNETPEVFAVAGGPAEITSIAVDLCTMLFLKADTSALPAQSSFRLWNCLPVGPFQTLVAKIKALHEFACNRVPLNCNTFTGVRSMSGDDSQVIVPAQAWPPPTPPPRPVPDPPPVKTYFFNMRGCVRFFGSTNVAPGTVNFARGTIQLKCGGNIIDEVVIGPWIYNQKGGSDRDNISQPFGGCFDFNGCVPCAIDEDLEVVFLGEIAPDYSQNLSASNLVGMTDFEVFALCF